LCLLVIYQLSAMAVGSCSLQLRTADCGPARSEKARSKTQDRRRNANSQQAHRPTRTRTAAPGARRATSELTEVLRNLQRGLRVAIPPTHCLPTYLPPNRRVTWAACPSHHMGAVSSQL
jgi:hypothetical protein